MLLRVTKGHLKEVKDISVYRRVAVEYLSGKAL